MFIQSQNREVLVNLDNVSEITLDDCFDRNKVVILANTGTPTHKPILGTFDTVKEAQECLDSLIEMISSSDNAPTVIRPFFNETENDDLCECEACITYRSACIEKKEQLDKTAEEIAEAFCAMLDNVLKGEKK